MPTVNYRNHGEDLLIQIAKIIRDHALLLDLLRKPNGVNLGEGGKSVILEGTRRGMKQKDLADLLWIVPAAVSDNLRRAGNNLVKKSNPEIDDDSQYEPA